MTDLLMIESKTIDSMMFDSMTVDSMPIDPLKEADLMKTIESMMTDLKMTDSIKMIDSMMIDSETIDSIERLIAAAKLLTELTRTHVDVIEAVRTLIET